MKALFPILSLAFILSGCPQQARINLELDALAFTISEFECKNNELESIKGKLVGLLESKAVYETQSKKVYDIAVNLNNKVARECSNAVLDACTISRSASTTVDSQRYTDFTDHTGPIEHMGISASQTTFTSKEEAEEYENYKVRIRKEDFVKAIDCLIEETKS